MELISDILLGAAAIGAGLYCLVLSRRLKAFSQLENGMGGAVAVLSAQVDEMTQALARARETAGNSADNLRSMTERAEQAAARLEIMLATLHDLPDGAAARQRKFTVARSRHGREAEREPAE
ncbi:hypothetical protein [Albidovulum sp.]